MSDFETVETKLARLEDIADVIEKDVAPKVCNRMRNTAVGMVTRVWSAVDTGALRNSIEGASEVIIREDDVTVEFGITSSSDHLRYVEFGTGSKGSNVYDSPAGGSYTAEGVTFQEDLDMWFQHNPDYNGDFGKNNDPSGVREWIPRFAQTPRPIMRPALYDNIPWIKDQLKKKLTEDFA